MKTFAEALLALYQKQPQKNLFYQKKVGLWKPVTTEQLIREVGRLLMVLERTEPKPGPGLLFGRNSIEFVYIELAHHVLGLPCLPVLDNATNLELQELVSEFQPSAIFCSEEQQLDTVLELSANFSGQLITLSRRGQQKGNSLHYDGYIARAELPSAADAVQMLKNTQPFSNKTFFIHSSGRAAFPHYSGFSQQDMLHIASNFQDSAGIKSSDSVVSFMPPGLYMERLFAFLVPLISGHSVFISEKEETFLSDLKQVSPTVFYAIPKVFVSFRRLAGFKISLTSLWRQFFWDYFYKRRNEALRFDENSNSFTERLREYLFERLYLRALRNRLGLLRCRLALSSGGELNEEVLYWFHGIGVKLYEFYGTAETGGQGFFSKFSRDHLASCGQSMPGIQCMLDDQGQILLNPQIQPFLSTLHKETQVIATADIGYLDRSERLKIVENSRNMLETDDGIVFSIRPAEEKLRENQYIREVFCLNIANKGTTAFLEIIPEQLRDEIHRDGRALLTYGQLVIDPMAISFFSKELKKENEDLVSYEKIKYFALLPEPLDEYRGELAYDLSPRRTFLAEKIETMNLETYEVHS